MSKARLFRDLHRSGCFVLPNPWDVGSARYLASVGFKALATTSAGFAFSRGLPDTVTALSAETMLEHTRELAAATPLPLNADFQAGYADEPEGVAKNVVRCVRTGVAGLSIEDATGDVSAPLYDRALAVERIRAARQAIDKENPDVVLTARCEAFLVGHPQARDLVFDRLVAYAEAGADCLFAPRVPDLKTIERLVKAVAPKPLNVVVASHVPGLSVARLAEAGVRRVSVGSGLARVAWGALMRATQAIAEAGSFEPFSGAASFDVLNGLFTD
jgi:2-methylisocitrate lyase-like PEP mutase family enzyme